MSAVTVHNMSDRAEWTSSGHASEEIVLVGDYDISDIATLTSQLDRVIVDGDSNPVVDLRGVTFMDASVLNALLRADRHLRTTSRELLLRSPSPVARRLLALCDGISPLGLRVIDDGFRDGGAR